MSTKIPYCDETLEVSGGCTKCSPGCRECWAIREVWRMAHNPLLKDKWQGLVEKKNGILDWTGKIKLFPEALVDKRLLSQKSKTFFVDSKCDLFHPSVPFEDIDKVYLTMREVKQHEFLILTKRVRRMDEFQAQEAWKLPNVHLGVTICNQAEADEKIPILLQIPAAHRWLSIEPMLEKIVIPEEYLGKEIDHPLGKAREKELTAEQFISGDYPDDFIDLIVIGCEKINNKPGRECKPERIKSIVDQCKAAGVKCFVKQMEVNGKVVHELKDMPDWAVQEMI